MERLHLQDIIQDMEDNFDYKKFIAEGKLYENEDIMVNPIIMFGGKKYIEDVISSPDDFGFDKDDAEWVKNNILSSPKMVSIQDYMDLDDKWVKQAQIDTSGGGALDHVVDGLKIHVKQELITPEQEKEAMKVVGLSEGVIKEELIWKVEGESADISDAGPEYRADVESQIKAIHPNISDEDLERAIDISNDQFYRNAREANKSDFGSGDRSLSSKDFVEAAVEIYQTDILGSDGEDDKDFDRWAPENLDGDFPKDSIFAGWTQAQYDAYQEEPRKYEKYLGGGSFNLAEGVIKENEEQGYTLYTTNVEYDNGKTGYMYQLVNSEDGEENEIGFDQLHFVGKGDASDPLLVPGKDFKDYDQYSYQEEEVSAEEAMKIYNELK
jgi:hypothetical protein